MGKKIRNELKLEVINEFLLKQYSIATLDIANYRLKNQFKSCNPLYKLGEIFSFQKRSEIIKKLNLKKNQTEEFDKRVIKKGIIKQLAYKNQLGMSEDTDTEQINNLVQAIQECEKTEENIQWVRTITEKDYDLINLFIIAFMEQFEDINKANSILIALKKLNDFAPDQVLPQMRENEKFPIAITQYIMKTTKIENLVGEAFILLIDIFQVSSFKSVTSEAFIVRLFDLLQIINDEETFNAIVKIFISISYEYKNPKENLVIKVASSHYDQRYFSETIIKFLNKNDEDLIIKTLQFIYDMYKVQRDFFYSHDFNVLVDVCIRESNNTNKENLREKFMEILLTLTETEEYKKKKPRRDSIFRLIETIQYSTVSNKSKNISNDIKNTLDKIY